MNQDNLSKIKKVPWLEKLLRVIILCAFIGVLCLLLNQQYLSRYVVPRYQDSYGYQEDHWVLSLDGQVLEDQLTTPHFRKLESGKTYAMSTVLTYDGSLVRNPSGFFFVDHMYCAVRLGDEYLFRYTPEEYPKQDRSKSPGNVYADFYLPHDCMGQELTIEFIPALDHGIDYQLPNPYFGDYSTTLVELFEKDLSQNIVAILAGFLGILAMIYSTLALPRKQYREGIYIGIFATLFAIYNLTESDFDFYVISNPYYTYLIDYTCFTLTPLFLLAFLRERLEPRQQPLALIGVLVGVLLFVSEMTLHFTGIMDMREFLPVLHITYGLSFFLFFGMILTMKQNNRKKALVLQMVPILIGIILDGANYYLHWNLPTSDSTFTAFGVIFFLVGELFHVWQYSLEVYTESIRSKEFRNMAFIDALTGIGNRRAFEAEKTSVTEARRDYQFMTIASVDLNDLKNANNTMGHAAGDFLIRSCANVLSDLAQDYGCAYRIGGDEFIVLLYDINQLEFEARLR